MITYDNLKDEAEKLESTGSWAEAASIWERLREYDRAIAALHKGGQSDRAAQILEVQGRFKEAAAQYASIGQHAQAALAYEKVHDFAGAARCYLRAGEREQAALVCEKAGLFSDAAKIYYSLRNFPKAIQLFEKAGEPQEAQRISQERGVRETMAQDEATTREQEYLALLQDQSGAFVDENKIVEAVFFFLQRSKIAEAARLYSHCREDIGYPVMTAVAGQTELETNLAKMFYEAKDFHKAAQVLESLEYFDKAAPLYEYSDDFERAAEMYAQTENMTKAAEMYEKSGKFSEAAQLFMQAGVKDRAAVNYERSHNHFTAGRLFFELGKGDKSLQLLQKVGRTEPRYLDATQMVVEILAAGGYTDLAIKKCLEAVHDQEVGEATAPLIYRAAVMQEEKGQAPQSIALYEKLLAWSFGYEDAKARVDALRSGAALQEITLEEVVEDSVEQSDAAVVTMMDGFDFLRETKLFSELSLDEMKLIYNLAEPKRFEAGQTLIEQGQRGKALYILRGGHVSVRKVKAGDETELARLGPGAPVGEMSLFDDAPTSARVVADEPVEAFEVSRESFDKIVAGSDRLALRIYRAFVPTLTQRLRQTSEKSGTR